MTEPVLDVVFENDHFIICDKPCGVLTVPERSADSGRRVLGLELQKMRGIQIFPVHRLDFVVSGLVLFAKDAEAHRVANDWFEQHLVHKTYRAWTHTQDFSHIPANVAAPRNRISLTARQTFEWRGRIKRGKRRAFEAPDGQPSITHATYLGKIESKHYLEWDLEPITGRPHQLRLDLSRHGFPIVGDALYGSTTELAPDHIALRAYSLNFAQIDAGKRFEMPDKVQTSSRPT